MTILMLLAVVAFVFVMRGRYKYKDDYRYEAAEYLMMGILWLLIALSEWNNGSLFFRALYIIIIVFSIYKTISVLYDHKKNAK